VVDVLDNARLSSIFLQEFNAPSDSGSVESPKLTGMVRQQFELDAPEVDTTPTFNAPDNTHDTALDSFGRAFKGSLIPLLPIPGEVGARLTENATLFNRPSSGLSGFLGSVAGSIVPNALMLLSPTTATVVLANFAGASAGEDLRENGNILSAIGAGVFESASEFLGTKLISKIGKEGMKPIGRALLDGDLKATTKAIMLVLEKAGVVEGGEEVATLVANNYWKVAIGVLTPQQALENIKREGLITFAGGVVGGAALGIVSLVSPGARAEFRSLTAERQAMVAEIKAMSESERQDLAVAVQSFLDDDVKANDTEIDTPDLVPLTDIQKDSADFILSVVVEDSSGSRSALDRLRKEAKDLRSEERQEAAKVEHQESANAVAAVFRNSVLNIKEKAKVLVLMEAEELQQQIIEERQFARQAIASTRAQERALANERVGPLCRQLKGQQQAVRNLNKDLRAAISDSGLPVAEKNKLLASTKSDIKTKEALFKRLADVVRVQNQVIQREAQQGLTATLKRADRVSKITPEQQELLESFTSMFQVVKPSGKMVRRLKGLQDFIERNPDALIPQKVLDRLTRLEGKAVADLSTQEANDANEVITSILHQIELKNKLLGAQGSRNRERTISTIAEEIAETLTRRRELPSGKLSKEPSDGVSKLVFGLEERASLDTMAEFLGGSDASTTWQTLFGDIKQGRELALDSYYTITDLWQEVIERTNLKLNSKKMNAKSPALAKLDMFQSTVNRERVTKAVVKSVSLANGQTIQAHSSELMFLAATLQDQETRELILLQNAPLVIQGQSTDKAFTLAESDVARIEAALESEDRIMVGGFLEIINGPLRDLYIEYSLRQFGISKAKNGTYFPRHRVGEGLTEAQLSTPSGARQAAMDRVSINRDRTEDTTNPIEIRDIFLEFANLTWTITNLRYISAPVQSARHVMGDPRIAKAIKESTRGTRASRRFTDHYDLLDSAVVGRSIMPRMSADTTFGKMARNVSRGALGLSPTVPFYQPLSLINAGFEIPARFLTRALMEQAQFNPAVNRRMKRVGALRFRAEGSTYSLINEGAAIGAQKQTLLGVPPKNEIAFSAIRFFDGMTVRLVWRAAELQAASERRSGALTEDQEFDRAAEIATRTVNRTQPTNDPLYSSGLVLQKQKGSGTAAMLSLFRGQTAKTVDMITREMIRANESPARRLKSSANILILIFGSGAMVAMVQEMVAAGLRGFSLPPEDEEGDAVRRFALRTMQRGIGVFVLGEWLVTAVKPLIEVSIEQATGIEEPFGAGRTFDPDFSPITGLMEDIARNSTRLVNKISNDAEAEEVIDVATDLAAQIGATQGLPLLAPVREAKKIYKRIVGEAAPQRRRTQSGSEKR